MNSGRWSYRSPLVCHLFDKRARKEFLFVLNHLARSKSAMRQQQAKGLREWGKGQTLPIICAGDFNFDWDFHTKKGNEAFRTFMQDDVWTWAKPAQLADTNWADRDGDGKDDYPDSSLGFVFVAGDARNWNPTCRVITVDGDFPDDEETSDHRPVECVLVVE